MQSRHVAQWRRSVYETATAGLGLKEEGILAVRSVPFISASVSQPGEGASGQSGLAGPQSDMEERQGVTVSSVQSYNDNRKS